jgi:hypothetical protein
LKLTNCARPGNRAGALAIDVPPAVLSIADEVIE